MKAMMERQRERRKSEKENIDQGARGKRNNLLFIGLPEKKEEKCDILLAIFFKEQ